MKNPISLDGLVSWLEQQDPAGRYSYNNGSGCLLFHYFDAIGLSVLLVNPRWWLDTAGGRHRIPEELNSVAVMGDDTYGGALAVARERLAAERAA